jgi:Skp family chaperone for outer membrane proteins
VIALTEGVVKAMLMRKLKALAGLVLVAALTMGGVGALGRLAATAPAAAADRPEDNGGSGAQAPAGPAPAAEPGGPSGVPPRALAPPAGKGARPPQTRIGLINMTRVLKGSQKLRALQAGWRAQTQESQQKLAALRKAAQGYEALGGDPATPAGRREELAQQTRRLRMEMQDLAEQARARLDRASGEALAAAYRDVEEAARRIAAQKGLDLVLFYTDAVTEADFYNPSALQRKLSQPGALVPLVAAPGMDITEAVIERLNRADARP